jgi:hypothetical protein
MQSELDSRIVFKFRRAASAPKKLPSRAMTKALQRLSEAEEMRNFTAKAHAHVRGTTCSFTLQQSLVKFGDIRFPLCRSGGQHEQPAVL